MIRLQLAKETSPVEAQRTDRSAASHSDSADYCSALQLQEFDYIFRFEFVPLPALFPALRKGKTNAKGFLPFRRFMITIITKKVIAKIAINPIRAPAIFDADLERTEMRWWTNSTYLVKEALLG